MDTMMMPPFELAVLPEMRFGTMALSLEPAIYPPPWIQTSTGCFVEARLSQTDAGTVTSSSRQSSDSGALAGGAALGWP